MFASAGWLGATLTHRVRATRLWFPTTVFFGSVAVAAGAGACGEYAKLSTDYLLQHQFERAANVGIGLSVPSIVNLIAVYPRNLNRGAVRDAVALFYLFGLAYALLSQTNLVFIDVGTDPAFSSVAYGPAFLPLQIILIAGLLAAMGWSAFLALRGRSGVERRAGAGLAVLIGAPFSMEAVSSAFEISNFGPLDVLAVYYGLSTAIIFGLFATGGFATPVPSSFHSLLDSIEEAVVVVDQEGRAASLNAAAERLLGGSSQDAAQRPLTEVVTRAFSRAEDVNRLQTSALGVLRGRMDSHELVVEGVGAARRTCRAQILPLGRRNPDGEAEAALIMLRDETVRHDRERSTARSRDVLDLVIRMLGHDLKAPLTVVQGYIDLDKARLESASDEKAVTAVRADLDKMTEALVEMQVLMGNARALSRLAALGEEELALSEVDLTRLVKRAIDTVRPIAAARQLSIESAVSEGVRAVVVLGFDSVPRNLLDNAIKYTPPGGVLKVGLLQEESKVVLSLADTGPGIPPEKLDLLFRKFERLGAEKGQQEGHGLGLSIVAKLVEFSKGKVAVGERDDGKTGAVFRVELPLPQKGN